MGLHGQVYVGGTRQPRLPMETATVLVATWTDGVFVFAGESRHHELAGQPVRGLASDGHETHGTRVRRVFTARSSAHRSGFVR